MPKEFNSKIKNNDSKIKINDSKITNNDSKIKNYSKPNQISEEVISFLSSWQQYMMDDLNNNYSILDIINKESEDFLIESMEDKSIIINFKELF